MSETTKIKATDREVVGKANRRLEPTVLPAVVYGATVKARSIAIDRHEFEQLLAHEAGFTSKLMKLAIEGGEPVNVIVKSVQRDPATGGLLHVDFWAVAMTQAIVTTVPVHFEGEAPGVKAGGVMMHNLQLVQIEALPGDLPDALVADISAMEVGDSIHVRDLVPPKGVTVVDSPDEIVASVVPPAKAEEEAPELEAEQPEVIGAEEEESAAE
jgi:large subunit ribosomal protein L25